ncbi:DNA-directed RNA polymerase sigma-70 factor [Sphaerisporangium melleum]|uniref:DNA-directed RNA polymerase sigma-70 factor n=1 Tax=Sphaerisporangium melleum TaxID=321316 RepID=A0A917R129_9ACTN|nr:sigma-70 family RNA polymerase sigma factor [Sphaerisporangium melleum]GGK82647.1 DNA-directed RNA polymerase sigma-70 factor [Sphaerisporangium melleum]GII69190.1 DNA-directed RNA polymerase sigma-70 factor [Sphaerisporangium melleum]
MGNATLADADLVREARSGDAGSLGLLLARHQADMRAVALSILGHSPDAEDAVQEAVLIVLRRIGDLRDPDAVGPWLRAIVRNVCRTQLRARRPMPAEALVLPREEPDPAELLDRHAQRDWVWHALDELSPRLRLVAMLRYFTEVTAYEHIAEVCGIPTGTVRSRLSQARAKLSQALLATASLAHDDVAAQEARRRRQAEETLRAARSGAFAEALTELCAPTVEITMAKGKLTHGFDHLLGAMDRDLGAGVQQRLANLVVGRDVVIWENDLINPPDDPFHCPPTVVWVNFLHADRVRKIRLFHPRPA